MAKFNLEAKITISVHTVVEANSIEDAIKIAEQRDDILHSTYQNGDPNKHWIVDEFDGLPMDIHLE